MADVKWIKLTVDMFDNRKIKHLRRLPEGNNIVLIWVMLLTMAGRCNAGGMIFLTENIPYTPKMLADELGFEENTVRLALEALEQLNMIHSDGFLSVSGWEEYQNVQGLDKVREQARLRQAKHRAKRKESLVGAGNRCAYCGGVGDTIDHVIPRSRGGLDIPENAVPCCQACNSAKKDKDVAEFLNARLSYGEHVDIDGILSNEVLQQYVSFDGEHFVTLQNENVTLRNAAEEDIEEDIERRNKKESNKTAKRFTPPTVDEVAEYCRERGNNIDAAHFVDYYSARGWELSKGRKLKDWKAAVRTWERNGYSKPRTGANGVRITDAKTDILDDIF